MPDATSESRTYSTPPYWVKPVPVSSPRVFVHEGIPIPWALCHEGTELEEVSDAATFFLTELQKFRVRVQMNFLQNSQKFRMWHGRCTEPTEVSRMGI